MNATPLFNNVELGLIHQFWVALEKCHCLSPGEALLIETDGDVSVKGSFQMELKHMAPSNTLTSSDLNLWNTLKNWTSDGFNSSNYRHLILRTTEVHGPQSIFKNWNTETSVDIRLNILEEHVRQRESDYLSRCDAAKKTKGKKPKLPESLKLMRIVVAPERKVRLREVAEKFYIQENAPDITGTYDQLRLQVCKGVTQQNEKAFLDSLGGFVIRPEFGSNQNGRLPTMVTRPNLKKQPSYIAATRKGFPSDIDTRSARP